MYAKLSHTTWGCKYHVVFIPKYRKKQAFSVIRRKLGPVFRELASRKETIVEEGFIMPDHVHMLLSILPKYSVLQVVGFLKGKSAIYIARNFDGKKMNFTGYHFWARGFFVSTVGRDEEQVRKYIQNQEVEDKRRDQLNLL